MRDEKESTRRSWWPWVLAAIATIVAVSLVIVVLTSDDDAPRTRASAKPSVPCESGVRWQQKFSPYVDGALIGVPALPEVAIVRGGARVGFPNPEEFTAMGFTTYMPIQAEDYLSIGLAPRDGLLFQERAFEDGPGRMYYSAGGAVYQVRNEEALSRIGVDTKAPIVIPSHGFDGAPRTPKTGTLLRLDGSGRTWIIDGGARRQVRNVCRNARINDLPNDAQVLDEVPVAAR